MSYKYAAYEISTGFGLFEDSTDLALYFDSASAIYPITKDDYFDRTQPAKSEELVNSVSVPVSALVAAEDEIDLYTSETQVTLAAGDSIEIVADYSSYPAEGVAATLAPVLGTLTIASAEYYAAAAVITVQNTGAASVNFILTVTGTPLEVSAERVISRLDEGSILSNGLLKYEYAENHLIQDDVSAGLIADSLLLSYKTPRKDVSITWRGDPALELGDVFEAPVYQRGIIDVRSLFYIYKNKITFDGTLRAITDGRKRQ